VSEAGAAEFPFIAQTYFCDSRSPLRDLPFPLRSRSSQFVSHPLTKFLAHSAPARLLLQYVSSSKLKKWADFYRDSSYASAVLAVVILYVCLSVTVCTSVCLSATRVHCDKINQCTADILIPHERAITLFLTPTVVGGRRPFLSQICAQSDPAPSKRADFDSFLLIMSQP